jgi:PAS domain-containing protein
MAKKINISLDLADPGLRDRLSHLISDDWTVPWSFVILEPDAVVSDGSVITVTDRIGHGSPLAPVIFVGTPPPGAGKCFAVVPSSDPETIFREIRRAYSHWEILSQNRESMGPRFEDGGTLESLAQSLSARVNQLMRQSEMRIALVDQLPVGIVGVDDENHVVLVNPKAIEILSVEDVPIWGVRIDHLLNREVGDFLYDEGREIMEYLRHGEPVEIRKSRFLLDGAFAGTILVLTRKTGL